MRNTSIVSEQKLLPLIMLKKNVAKCLKDIEKIMKKYVIILAVSKNMYMWDRLIQGLLELLWTVYSEGKLKSRLKLRNFQNPFNKDKSVGL